MGVAGPNAELTDAEAIAVVESIMGGLSWDGTRAFVACPGIHMHSRANLDTDCKIEAQPFVDTKDYPPGCYCFHSSCQGVRDDLNRRLRSALGKQAFAKDPLPKAKRTKPAPPLVRLAKPVFDPVKLDEVAARVTEEITPEWLDARSAMRTGEQTPATFVASLFREGEKVVVFDVYQSQGAQIWTHPGERFDPKSLDHFRNGRVGGAARQCCGVWILNCPVTGEWYPKEKRMPDGTTQMRRTRRDWRAVTSWRYLLLESDKADPKKWLKALVQMPLPIVSMVTSGNASIHALVRLNCASKEEWDSFGERIERTLVPLGADAGAISGVRLTRLPFCLRHGKLVPDDHDRKVNHYHPFPAPRMQRLLYLNPAATSVPIIELPTTL